MSKNYYAPPSDDDNGLPPKVLGGNSPIQVKFIGWLVVTCAAGFGGWIWWAASISTKLDLVITNQTVQAQNTKEVIQAVATLNEWRVKMDGMEISKRLDRVETNVREIGKSFELHKAMSATSKSNP